MTDLDLDECQECKHLGRCCWFAVDIAPHNSGRMMKVYTRVACPFLNKTSGLCTRYETRSEVPWCKAWWYPNEKSSENNQPSWCPRNDPDGAMMIESSRFFLHAGGDPKDLEEFRRRLDGRAIEEMSAYYETYLREEGLTLEVGEPLEPTESPATPLPEYKRKQQRKKLYTDEHKKRDLAPADEGDKIHPSILPGLVAWGKKQGLICRKCGKGMRLCRCIQIGKA